MAPAVPRVVPVGYRILNDTFGSKVPSTTKSGSGVERMAACAVRPAHARSAPPAWPVFKEVVMKLYFAPGACSLSPHIVMREAGAQYDLEQVNNQEKKTKSGMDYGKINAKARAPVLDFENGERLTKGLFIVHWTADQTPPPAGVP